MGLTTRPVGSEVTTVGMLLRVVVVGQGNLPFWFKFHVGVQRVGLVVAIAGFGVAVAMQHAGRHFVSTHSILGLTVMVVGVMQPINAMIRPKPSPRTAWRRVRDSGGERGTSRGQRRCPSRHGV